MSIAITIGGELAFPSKYIGEPDLKGKDVTLTIAKVQRDALQMKGGRKEKKIVLYFEQTDKMMVLNKTNAMTVAGLYGGEMMSWTGKRITLYPTTTQFGRNEVVCVRVREQVPSGGRQQARGAADVPGVVIPRAVAPHTGLPDVTKPEVFYEFMEQTAAATNVPPEVFAHAMSEAGKVHALADIGNAGKAARLNVAIAANEGRFMWDTGLIQV